MSNKGKWYLTLKCALIVTCFLFHQFAVAGDIPCNATLLSNDMLEFETYSFNGLTDSGVSDPSCSEYGGPDIWFEVVCPPSGRITIVTLPGVTTDAAMSVYSGPCNNLEEVLCVETDLCGNTVMPIQDIFDLMSGQSYFIRLWPENGSPGGDFDIRVSDGPPPNDLFDLVNNSTYITVVDEECIRLTTEGTGQTGCAWDADQYDFNLPIDISLSFNFGDMDGGADGICIVFQDSPAGLSACGNSGQGIGSEGIGNSLIIEFDTWQNGNLGDPVADHIAVNVNGNMGAPIAGPVNLPNIEDNQFHTMQFTWDPISQFYEVYFDGNFQLSGNYDVINNCFGGSNLAYYGFTASTGGAVNTHIVCPHPVYPSGNERDEEAEICEGDSYFAGGGLQTVSGTYTDIYTTLSGCDSIVHTILTVNQSSETFIDTTICDDDCFEMGGLLYCQSGDYDQVLLGASASGCDSSLYLDLNVLDPQAIILPPDTLTCVTEEIILNGSLSTEGPGVIYSWTGPGGFNSDLQSPTITEGGLYNLLVIQEDDEVVCLSNNYEVEVIQNTDMPIADAGQDLVIDCESSTVILGGPNSSSGPNIFLQWTGPNNYVSNEIQPEVNQGGQYILTVINQLSECYALDFVFVEVQVDTPDINLSGSDFLCSTDSLQIYAQSNDTLGYNWSGPNSFVSQDQNPFVYEPGTYFVEAMSRSGCSVLDTLLIDSDDQGPQLTLAADTLNCILDNVMITTVAIDSIIEYSWTGPAGFTSSEQNPSVSMNGQYELTAKGINGCSTLAIINVNGDFVSPQVELIGDTIACGENEIQIIANVSDSSLIYNWTGPGGFSSAEQNPFVQTNGFYYLTVISENGCYSIDSVEIYSDYAVPQLFFYFDTIDCNNAESFVEVITNFNGVSFVWTGPGGFESDSSEFFTDIPGLYELNATATNGCTAIGSVQVEANLAEPIIDIEADTLSCSDSEIMISSNPQFSNYTYSWIGPNNYSSSDENPIISDPGDYSVTVTGDNGCSSVKDIVVLGDFDNPLVNLEADTINCLSSIFFIVANSNSNDLDYNWTGPNGYISANAVSEVFNEGLYILESIAINGCSSLDSVLVIKDDLPPNVSLESGEINCFQDTFTLTPIGDLENLELQWMGPDNFQSSESFITINNAGIYFLIATGENGCVSLDSSEVFEDFDIADVDILPSEIIDCENNGVQIQTNIQGDVDYIEWKGPQQFSSQLEDPFVSEAGEYFVSVISTNGCIAKDSIVVSSNVDLPDLSLEGELLTCENPMVSITASTSIINGAFSWSGPQNYQSNSQDIQISEPGWFIAELVNLDNQCVIKDSIEIIDNRIFPDFTLEANTITCKDSVAQLLCLIDSLNYEFNWSGPLGYNAVNQNPTTSFPGIYSLEVLNPSNGCLTEESVAVEEILGPSQIIVDVKDPDCGGLSGEFIISDVIGGTSPYLYSINEIDFQTEPTFGDLDEGFYSIIVEDFYRCRISSTVEIVTLENPEIILDEEIVVELGSSYQLIPQLNIPESELEIISWDPGTYLDCTDCLYPNVTPNQSIIYFLNIVDVNGCESSARIQIRVKTPEIYSPTVFSPNGDGINDYFTLYGNPEQVSEIKELIVFDRWGNKVFDNYGFDINYEEQGWDGKIKGKVANPAVFVFIATVTLNNGINILMSGSISLLK